MDDIGTGDLKSILHSKRANLYYLEHCRVLVNGGRVEYVTDEGKRSLYWNIPIANTTTTLLGTGRSERSADCFFPQSSAAPDLRRQRRLQG